MADTKYGLYVGAPVVKVTGDYHPTGTIVAIFTTLKGNTRYVVEHDYGMLHIYSAANLLLDMIVVDENPHIAIFDN